MAGRATVLLTTAPAGSGKTYARFARYIWDEFLPHGDPDSVHCSNFPARMEPWSDPGRGEEGKGLVGLACDRLGLDADTVRGRVRQIPQAVLDSWLREGECDGPWNYFRDLDIDGWHIAIDEAHSYFPARGRPQHAALLRDWLAEIRHRGATVEFITQNPMQVCSELRRACGEKIQLTNLDNEVEPVFGCRVGDWLELKAKVTGRYLTWVRQEWYSQWGLGWKRSKAEVFSLDPWYFGLYDSFSRPAMGGGSGKGARSSWERFGWFRLVWWFVSRNSFPLMWRAGVVLLFVWLLFFDGQAYVVGKFNETIQKAFAGKGKAVAGAPAKGAPAARPAPGKAVLGRPGGEVAGPRSVHFVDVDEKGVKWCDRPYSAAACDELEAAGVRVAKAWIQSEDRAQALAARVAELEARIGELGSVVLVGTDSVRFENGDVWRVGDKIDLGPYSGDTVASLDQVRRLVRLASGRCLRLGGVPPAAVAEGRPKVPGHLQRVADAGSDKGKTGREKVDLQGSGHGLSRSGSVDRGPDRGIDRR